MNYSKYVMSKTFLSKLLGLNCLHIYERDETQSYQEIILDYLVNYLTPLDQDYKKNIEDFIELMDSGRELIVNEKVNELMFKYKINPEIYNESEFIFCWENLMSSVYITLLYNFPELFSSRPTECGCSCKNKPVLSDDGVTYVLPSRKPLGASYVGCLCKKENTTFELGTLDYIEPVYPDTTETIISYTIYPTYHYDMKSEIGQPIRRKGIIRFEENLGNSEITRSGIYVDPIYMVDIEWEVEQGFISYELIEADYPKYIHPDNEFFELNYKIQSFYNIQGEPEPIEKTIISKSSIIDITKNESTENIELSGTYKDEVYNIQIPWTIEQGYKTLELGEINSKLEIKAQDTEAIISYYILNSIKYSDQSLNIIDKEEKQKLINIDSNFSGELRTISDSFIDQYGFEIPYEITQGFFTYKLDYVIDSKNIKSIDTQSLIKYVLMSEQNYSNGQKEYAYRIDRSRLIETEQNFNSYITTRTGTFIDEDYNVEIPWYLIQSGITYEIEEILVPEKVEPIQTNIQVIYSIIPNYIYPDNLIIKGESISKYKNIEIEQNETSNVKIQEGSFIDEQSGLEISWSINQGYISYSLNNVNSIERVSPSEQIINSIGYSRDTYYNYPDNITDYIRTENFTINNINIPENDTKDCIIRSFSYNKNNIEINFDIEQAGINYVLDSVNIPDYISSRDTEFNISYNIITQYLYSDEEYNEYISSEKYQITISEIDQNNELNNKILQGEIEEPIKNLIISWSTTQGHLIKSVDNIISPNIKYNETENIVNYDLIYKDSVDPEYENIISLSENIEDIEINLSNQSKKIIGEFSDTTSDLIVNYNFEQSGITYEYKSDIQDSLNSEETIVDYVYYITPIYVFESENIKGEKIERHKSIEISKNDCQHIILRSGKFIDDLSNLEIEYLIEQGYSEYELLDKFFSKETLDFNETEFIVYYKLKKTYISRTVEPISMEDIDFRSKIISIEENISENQIIREGSFTDNLEITWLITQEGKPIITPEPSDELDNSEQEPSDELDNSEQEPSDVDNSEQEELDKDN